jgi:hypothetical protein
MKSGPERSLKSQNMKWLVMMAIADIAIVVGFLVPGLVEGITLTTAAIVRGSASTVIPVLVLLLVNVMPHDVKSMLVYWKPRGILPGTEAFTKHAPADPRIDMASLKRHVGTLPVEPGEQNAKWYKLYKLVPNEPEVAEAHRLFLLYRDMAALSLPLVVLVPLLLASLVESKLLLLAAASLFLVQYLITAVSAKWSGIRFVTNVLALHSARKITGSKPAAVAKSATP